VHARDTDSREMRTAVANLSEQWSESQKPVCATFSLRLTLPRVPREPALQQCCLPTRQTPLLLRLSSGCCRIAASASQPPFFFFYREESLPHTRTGCQHGFGRRAELYFWILSQRSTGGCNFSSCAARKKAMLLFHPILGKALTKTKVRTDVAKRKVF